MKNRNVRRGQTLSVEKEQRIGGGAASWVYALDNGNIVKVLKHGSPEEAEREILLSKWAFLKGIPTAISYDVADVDGYQGLVYEFLGHENLRNAFRDRPECFDELMDDYLSLLHTVNGITDDEEYLPAAIEQYRISLESLSDLLTAEEIAKTKALLESIPDSDTIIHGDCQIKNVRVVNGKLFLIDLDTLSRGNPIFELAALFCCYRCYPALSEESHDTFFDIPSKMLAKILDGVLDGYFPGLPKDIRDENASKIALLGWLITAGYVRHDSPNDSASLKLLLNRFRETLAVVDNLCLMHA